MNRKLLASTVVAASLLAPAVAFAQTDNTATGNNAPAMQKPANHPTKMGTHHGSTTGMSSSKSHTSGKSTSHKSSGSTY